MPLNVVCLRVSIPRPLGDALSLTCWQLLTQRSGDCDSCEQGCVDDRWRACIHAHACICNMHMHTYLLTCQQEFAICRFYEFMMLMIGEGTADIQKMIIARRLLEDYKIRT